MDSYTILRDILTSLGTSVTNLEHVDINGAAPVLPSVKIGEFGTGVSAAIGYLSAEILRIRIFQKF